MDKYFNQIIGTDIVTENGTLVGRVGDMVIDPDTGKVLGFLLGFKNKKIITPVDVLSWNQRMIIHDIDDVFDLEEIIKAEKVVKRNVCIMQNKVVTKGGLYLGKVYDFSVHHQMFILTKILITKSFLGIFNYDKKIVAHHNILEIKQEKIIVKDPIQLIPVREKKASVPKAKLRVDIIPTGCRSNN